MIEGQRSLPKWILIISGLIALMEIIVSISLVLSPESVLETVDLNAKGVDYLVQMWAVRQFALGVIFGYATMKGSRQMLTIAYVFFLVMMLGDILIGIRQNNTSLIIAALLMGAFSALLLFLINRKATAN